MASSFSHITGLIQGHNSIDHFNYDIVVDWAIELLNTNPNSENLAILASFSTPVDTFEIKPYVENSLTELGLPELTNEAVSICRANYHLTEILNDSSIRKNLTELCQLFLDTDSFHNDDKFNLMPFYLLYHGWIELDELGVNYYYDGATKENIEDKIKEEASNWLLNNPAK